MEDYGAPLHSWLFRGHDIALLFATVGVSQHLDEMERKWLPTVIRTCPGIYVILLGIVIGEKTAAERHGHRRRSEELLQRFRMDEMATYAEYGAKGAENLQQVLEQVSHLSISAARKRLTTQQAAGVVSATKAAKAPDPVLSNLRPMVAGRNPRYPRILRGNPRHGMRIIQEAAEGEGTT